MLTIIGILISTLITIIGIYFIYKGEYNENPVQQLIGAAFIVFSAFIGVGVFCILKDNLDSKSNVPQAIDVYRGKTTLEITYRDSIPVDSVVVFKNK